MAAPSLSTDQLAALVELDRCGSLRTAAESLAISEQGLRSRLVALERRLGTSLYRKQRGPRRESPLTPAGRRLMPHALSLLERCREIAELFVDEPPDREISVVASQYLIAFLLIRAVARFQRVEPQVRVRLSARTEREIEQTLLDHPEVSCGVAAPYEPSQQLEYTHLFAMPWTLIAPRGHAILRRRRLRLGDLRHEPLIMYERGSTGRRHIMEAFQHLDIAPRIELEGTNTDLIVRMVEAGLGVAIVPLLADGAVTRGRRVAVGAALREIRPIDSGILMRAGETPSAPVRAFVEFVRRECSR